MKRIVLLLVIAACAGTLQAQAPDTTWKHTLVAGISATQVSYSDWTQGGENAVSWTLTLDGRSEMRAPIWNWANNYKFAYGQTKLGSRAIRKTEDKIDLESVLSYRTGWVVNPYVAATLKTQFTAGYTYDAADNRTQVSDFFDPAFLTQSVGGEFRPAAWIKTRIGVALREVITKTYNQYADDKTTPEIEKTKTEGGLESVTDIQLTIDDNVLFTSRLELFDPFKHMDRVVVRSDNMLSAKVGRYIVVSLNVVLVNDVQITPRTQVKQTLALGINYSIF
ncbi:MAG: DUF3078 domain-containing protein [Acidobacteriota bacterium]